MKKLTITVTVLDEGQYGLESNTGEAALAVNYGEKIASKFIIEQLQEVLSILVSAAEGENKKKSESEKETETDA